MAIHQIVAGAAPGDAVTNTALDFETLLQRVGPSRVYGCHIDPRLGAAVLPLSAFEPGGDPDDLIVYHLSIGEPEIVEFLLRRPERLVIVYHNIAPAEYYAVLDPRFAALLAGGRLELGVLRARAVLALAVSEYNADELEAAGYADVRVCPLPVDIGALSAVEPDPETMAELKGLDGPLVLFVGQLLPHKRPDLLIQAYHVLTTYLRPEAHLVLLGTGRFERYSRALGQLVAELNLHQASLPGWLTLEELAAHYRNAAVFITMSEHEGVCIPLLEAMSFDVPVIARRYAAIPETMGDAGLLLPADAGPLLVAEALDELIGSQPLRAELIRRGRRQVEGRDVDTARATFLRHIASVA
jgi:glycosyltransferase involved in cell wall biosynthesis